MIGVGICSIYFLVFRVYDGIYLVQCQELVEGWLGYDLLQYEFIDYWCWLVYWVWLQMYLLVWKECLFVDVDYCIFYVVVYQGLVMLWINLMYEVNVWELLVKVGFVDEVEVVCVCG